jgi:hypothetical protein
MPATVHVCPWPDSVIDTIGHDPRSMYVETFWLPTLGPTTLLLLRHLAAKFEQRPQGLELPVADTSLALGLGPREGNSSPLMRSLGRLGQFDLACDDGRGTVAVRRNLPPVNPRHLRRLPAELQVSHAEWADTELADGPLAAARRRARRVAFTLIEQGDDLDHAERTLHATGFHPSLCREAARWAYQRHCDARDTVLADVRETSQTANGSAA